MSWINDSRYINLLYDIGYELGLVTKYSPKPIEFDNFKSWSDEYLLVRGASLDSWYKSFHNFFLDARGYYKSLILQKILAKKIGLDPLLVDSRERRVFYNEIGTKTDYAYDSRTIDRWVKRDDYPTFDQLETASSAHGIDVEHFGMLNLVDSTRFAVARTACYVVAYPWKKLPLGQSRYRRKVCKTTKEVIKKLPFLGADVKNLHVYIKNQLVFDSIFHGNVEAQITEDSIKPLVHFRSILAQSELTERTKHHLESVNMVKMLLIFGNFAGGSTDYSWAFRQTDPRYIQLWGCH